MFANDATPSSDEKAAIFKWATKREWCFTNYGHTGDNYFNEFQSLILDLYKGNLTYGQLAKIDKERRDGMVAQQQMQIQQQQMQQQQERQQQTQWQRQACLNRARNQFDVANCSMEAAGAGLGEAIGNMINR